MVKRFLPSKHIWSGLCCKRHSMLATLVFFHLFCYSSSFRVRGRTLSLRKPSFSIFSTEKIIEINEESSPRLGKVTDDNALPEVKEIFDKTKQAFGFVPCLSIHGSFSCCPLILQRHVLQVPFADNFPIIRFLVTAL